MASVARVVLLGANGQLGSDIRTVFEASDGVELCGLTRADLDVEDAGRIGGVLREIPFDWLINCTSYHRTDECEDFPARSFAVNAEAVRQLARACEEKGAVMAHVSTDYVFDGRAGRPYVETDAPGPLNVYGVSKLAGEQLVRAYCERHFVFRVASLFGVAGSSGKGGNFVETMLRMAREGKPLRVIRDQVMSPTHTLDIARALLAFVERGVSEYGVYHCAGAGACSWHEFACAILARAGLAADVAPVLHTEYATKARRPLYSALDSAKLGSVHRMPDWRAGLDEYMRRKGY